MDVLEPKKFSSLDALETKRLMPLVRERIFIQTQFCEAGGNSIHSRTA
jgi:hypothetical protein